MSDTSILDSLCEIIQVLYIYGSLDDEKINLLNVIKIFNYILLTIFCLNLFKLSIILLYYFWKCIVGFKDFCKYCWRKKFCVNYCVEFKNFLFFLGKIVKKMFTYNFYSYENKFQGFVMYFTYFTFIIINLIFNLIKMYGSPKAFQELQFFAFETTLLMEILIVSFYVTRNFKNQFIILLSSFVSLNSVIGFGLLFKMKYSHLTTISVQEFSGISCYLKTLANIIFLLYFTIMYIIALYEVFSYDLCSKFNLNY